LTFQVPIASLKKSMGTSNQDRMSKRTASRG
jgi:hypothetical protein